MRPSFLLYELAGSHDSGEDFKSSKGCPVPRNWVPGRHESFAKQILLPGTPKAQELILGLRQIAGALGDGHPPPGDAL
jgi:hypothetical protein